MDDRLFYDPAWSLVVASLDMRLARVRARRTIYRRQRETRCDLSCHIPRSRADELRSLGEPVVRV